TALYHSVSRARIDSCMRKRRGASVRNIASEAPPQGREHVGWGSASLGQCWFCPPQAGDSLEWPIENLNGLSGLWPFKTLLARRHERVALAAARPDERVAAGIVNLLPQPLDVD